MRNFTVLFIFLITCLISCNQKEIPLEGYVDVKGGKIWYKIVGQGDKTPLLILHGGPGSRSCSSMSGYSLLADERPVIFYDQLGSGNSDRPEDTTLWEVSRFVDEIDRLREKLQLEELHILGGSWGGALLAEYMITKQPEGVKSVIFKSPLISTKDWMEDAKILISQMSQNLQDTINKYEALQQYDALPYIAATDSFYARYLFHVQYPPVQQQECDGVPGFNYEVYNYMWGPTEFTALGTLKDFDRVGDLSNIKEPVFFLAGEYDEARPETMYRYQKLIPDSKVVIIEDAGHACVTDQPEATVKAIRDFLRDVEFDNN